ncbi:MAG: PaaI family thioesterase [Candidatus Coatesbacteria bacterium]|nr:PaaI family thioesterase [Candidatus Coatesbacteria bacterium]
MKEVENYFLDWEDYNCFACDPNHTHGLRMKFLYDEETGIVSSKIEPRPDLEGYPGLLHGGIQTTILDEVGFWALTSITNKIAVTVKIMVEFVKPVSGRIPLIAKAKLTRERGKIAYVDAWLEESSGKVLSKAEIVYFITSKDKIEDALKRELDNEKP